MGAESPLHSTEEKHSSGEDARNALPIPSLKVKILQILVTVGLQDSLKRAVGLFLKSSNCKQTVVLLMEDDNENILRVDL